MTLRESRDRIELKKAQQAYLKRAKQDAYFFRNSRNSFSEDQNCGIIKWDEELHPRDENGRFTNNGGITSPQVDGPSQSGQFIRDYFRDHLEVEKGVERYMGVMDSVRNFEKNNPGIPEGTYNAVTGEPIKPEDMDGYCVTFHQNLSIEDPFGAYDSYTYAAMCAITMNELGAKSVNIGYFGGNPEVSFICKDQRKVVDFAIAHNQHSVFDPSEVDKETGENGVAVLNAYYNPKTNPIEGHEEN